MPTINGFELEQLKGAAEAVSGSDDVAKLIFRGHTTWDSAVAVDSSADEIEQAGNVMKRTFKMRGDHPPELLGGDTGPTAVESLVAALGSCVAGTYAAQAAARGIALQSLEVGVETWIDLNGFMQTKDTPAGLRDVKLTLHVTADADQDALDEVMQVTAKASPVYNTIAEGRSIEAVVKQA